MDKKTFNLVADRVGAELKGLGYQTAEDPKPENGTLSAVFAGDGIYYGVFYLEEKKLFELRSCDAPDDTVKVEWKVLSSWLFDPETDNADQAADVASDFLETIRGPKQKAVARSKKKRRKDDDNNIDPVFFFNRFAGIFPDLKDEMNDERDLYGDVRTVTFARQKLLPKLEALCFDGTDTDAISRCCTLFNDLYKNGDLDVRSVITIVLLNGLSDTAREKLEPQFTDDMAKGCKAGLRMKDKKVKPEKTSKRSQIIASTLNDVDKH